MKKTTKKIFTCDCGCDQKIQVLKHSLGKLQILDIGFMQGKNKQPKLGIVLRSDMKLKDFKEFVKL